MGLLGAGTWYSYTLYEDKVLALKVTEDALASSTRAYIEARERNESLNASLQQIQGQNTIFSNQISEIGATVGTLQKLATTDVQLLAKYSKVYFLNEHYIPTSLTAIDSSFVFQKDKKVEILSEVDIHLQDMFEDAKDDGINLRVISGYRSFNTQEALKLNYKITYGSGTANSFSADQGYSEHQLGTALDLTTEEIGTSFTTFDKTTAYTWLQENAWKYGFVLSYPKNNAYYKFEPWHWRYVGKSLAELLYDRNMNFYDMDQREINTYLAEIFDN